jgi:circadian clock protein KaiC
VLRSVIETQVAERLSKGHEMISSSRAQPERAGTGIEGLDQILGGGLPRDRLYLIEGNAGAGKTTLSLQFLQEGVRLGEPVLYVTLSETMEELRAVAASHVWSLEGVSICDLAASEESLKADAQYTLFHPSEVELGETTRMVLDEVERIQPTRVVLDSLSEVRLLARDPLRYRRQILALKQFFSAQRCTVLLLDDQATEPGDMQLRTLVHGVLLLEQVTPEYGKERRRICVSKLRGVRYRGGYHDYTIETGGLVVYPRLAAAEHHQEFVFEPLSSGVPELDSFVGGLYRGTSALIMGPPGTGKSSLATLYAVAVANRGERAAFYTFDEGLRTLTARSAALGLDLRPHMEVGRITVRQVDPAELTAGEFAHMVRQSVEREKAGVVIIDSLSGYLNAMPEERFLTAHLHELLAYLNQRGVLTLMVMAQHGLLGSDAQAPVDVSYLADTVVLLRYFEAAGEVRRAISVLKKRVGTYERTIRELRIADHGIQIGEPLTEFHGVLTGIPVYQGESGAALRNHHEPGPA